MKKITYISRFEIFPISAFLKNRSNPSNTQAEQHTHHLLSCSHTESRLFLFLSQGVLRESVFDLNDSQSFHSDFELFVYYSFL